MRDQALREEIFEIEDMINGLTIFLNDAKQESEILILETEINRLNEVLQKKINDLYSKE